jgi:predicted transcriptional regulator
MLVKARTKKNRAKLDIMVQILQAIEVDSTIGASSTRLMRGVETSYDAITRYLKEAIELGMVEQHINKSGRSKTFTVTKKGREFIEKYLGLTRMITTH